MEKILWFSYLKSQNIHKLSTIVGENSDIYFSYMAKYTFQVQIYYSIISSTSRTKNFGRKRFPRKCSQKFVPPKLGTLLTVFRWPFFCLIFLWSYCTPPFKKQSFCKVKTIFNEQLDNLTFLLWTNVFPIKVQNFIYGFSWSWIMINALTCVHATIIQLKSSSKTTNSNDHTDN